jgi:hypothetical protein
MIQHWLCYRRYPESRCITLFIEPDEGTPAGGTVKTDEEANWREEFVKAGPTEVRQNLSNGAI